MKYYKNGNSVIATIGTLNLLELTEDEYNAEIKSANERQEVQAKIYERTRPKTFDEGMTELAKTLLSEKLDGNEDKTLAIACMAFFEPWIPNVYHVGDVRTDSATGYPYECILAHDSTTNPDWNISVRTLWKPYHSTKKEYALPWEQPTGAHDLYKTGEFMIWTDYEIYKCLADTNFSPTDYAGAWEKQ